MTENDMKRGKEESGTIILETSFVLPLFILVIAFIYGIFAIVNAQNVMTHALVQTTDSLALDAYVNEHVHSVSEANSAWNTIGKWESLSDMLIDTGRVFSNEYFASTVSATETTAKKRFIGYLNGGDRNQAIEKLKALKVTGGLDGVKFSVSKAGSDITVSINYELQFLIDFGGIGKIPMQQSFTSRLWS